ncbi:MAG: FAD:protein FMN transferase [Deltaproteobacteria bacterium]|nr:FAD:protein FMN transferase [Deltaproteobacteria bacterium]
MTKPQSLFSTAAFCVLCFAFTLAFQTNAWAGDTSTCVENDVELPPELESTNVERGSIRRAKTSSGTSISLGVSKVDCETATKAFKAVWDEFDRVEKLTSTKEEGTGLVLVNAAAGKEPVVVEKELFALVQLSLDFARQSDGAFDPTFAAVYRLYDFRKEVVPDAKDLETALANVDFRKVILDESDHSIFLKETGMSLSLGGIKKGYAIDRSALILRELGVEHFIFRSPSELTIIGEPGGGSRRVGVPALDGKSTLALLEVKDRSLNISRDLDASFEKDGVRYHHILDPSTGVSAHHVRTVGLVSHDATSADALSTAVFVLGPQRGMALVERLRGVEAIVLDVENRLHISSGMQNVEVFSQ